MKKAVILFSGGLDSTTCLAFAKQQGFDCYALSFDYGQRHAAELLAAKKIAANFQAKHTILQLPIAQFGGSALTDHSLNVPTNGVGNEIPITYVPARNTIFLSYALAFAETIAADDIFVGVSAIDYSNYPDCRPEYIEAFQHLANLATKIGTEHGSINIHAPLIHLSKAETIAMGESLGVNYGDTVSCYQLTADGYACGECDSCILRKKGFAEASVADPTNYASNFLT